VTAATDRRPTTGRNGTGVLPPASIESLRSYSRAIEYERPATSRDSRRRAREAAAGLALLYLLLFAARLWPLLRLL